MWSAVEKWGAQFVSTVVFLLLARLLGPETFGLVALANVFLAFMQIFLDQGFAEAIIQKDELEPEHLDTAFWTSVLMGAVFILILFVGAGFVADIYNEPQLAPIIRWMSFSFLFGGLSSVQAAILKRDMQFKVFAVRSLIATVACGVAGIGTALAGWGIWSLVVKELVYGSVGAISLWSISDWRPGFRFSPQHFRELFSYGINIIGFNFLNFFNRRSDDMLIGYFLGPVALGYYSVAYRLLLVMIQLLTGITAQVSLSAFSRMQKDTKRLRDAFYEVTKYTSLISFPAFLGVVVLAPELVRVVFGEQWMPSVPVMQVLAFIGIIQSVSQFNSNILLALGKPNWRLIIQTINVVLNVITFLIVVRWGIVAVASGFVIRGYLLYPLSIFMIKKFINIDIKRYLGQFQSAFFSALVMSALVVLIKYFYGDSLGTRLVLVVCIPVAILSYLVSIWLLSPSLIKEIRSKFT